MRTLVTRYKKKKRKASHLLYLRETIVNLHNEIVQDVLKGEYIFNKNTTVCQCGNSKHFLNIWGKSNIPNKARLLKKYNRRLKWLLY
jgi:hypothetical protein